MNKIIPLVVALTISAPALTAPKSEDSNIQALQRMASTVEENANKKSFLKHIGARKIVVKAEPADAMNKFGTLRMKMYYPNEKASYQASAKMMVESILDKYRQDTKQDPMFTISASLFSDTRVQYVKHHFARIKYLPMIDPMVRIDSKDMLVDSQE